MVGPPRRHLSHPDYAREFGAEIFSLDDEERPARRPPLYEGPGRDLFLSRVAPTLPASSILRLRRARIVGPDGWVIAPGDVFLSDASWYRGDPSECAIHDLLRARPRRTLPGLSLSLASDWAWSNYCHFLLDSLPRLATLGRAGLRLEDCDHIIFPDLRSRTADAIVARLQIPPEKIVPLSTLGIVECEELLVPTFPGLRRNIGRRQVRFIQQNLCPETTRPETTRPETTRRNRRLYIHRGRGTRRSITNEPRVIDMLLGQGFELYTPGSGLADFAAFAEAAIVIGAHGAALANAAACHPGATVIEILPDGFLYPYYYTLADSADCSYACLVGEPGQTDPRNQDFSIDVDRLESLVRAVVPA